MAAKNWAVVAALIGCMMLAACSNIETPDFAADADQIVRVDYRDRAKADWQPIPLRVGVAPMRAALEATAAEFNKEDTRRWVLPTDRNYMNGEGEGKDDSLNTRLIAAMSEPYPMFESVRKISFATSETPPDELLRLALSQGFDVVLQPTIRLNEVKYVDSNAAYGWNMFVWWMVSPIISWWIADEEFGINLHLDLRMFPVTQNRQISSVLLQPREPIQRSLDDWDQGWHALGIFSTPGYMGEDNWNRIGEKLRPVAENELKKALLRYITTDLKTASGTKRFRDDVRKRVALVVGVDGGTNPPRYAGQDANALSEHLENAESLPVPQGVLRTLVGSKATRTNIESEADELAKLARRNDDVLLMFSGAGTVDDQARPALVLAQAGGQASQVVVLEELVDKLAAGKPRSVTLLLDCSFAAPGDRRCVLSEKQHTDLIASHKDRSLFEPIRQKLEAAGIKCVILAASDAVPTNPHGMKALEIDELQKGLFTSFALDAMQGRADNNGDGVVSYIEFEAFVKEKVSHVARLERENQTGYFYITEDFKNEFLLPSGTRPAIK